jgi:hypothetical protein
VSWFVALARRVPPGLLLFFLAPLIAELFSGSTPPFAYFHPLFFAVNTLFYGSGALLIREAAFRWHKGWPTIFMLGAAYGVLEEGLAIRSFFSPDWPALGILGHYGRWLGVNWLWVAQLILQHAIISIAIPILIVSMIYPERRGAPWVGPWKRRLLWVLLAAPAVLLYVIIPYRVPTGLYLLCAGFAVALVLISRILPRHLLGLDGEPRPSQPGPRPIWYLILGFAGVVGLYFLPQHVPIPAVLDFFLICFAAFVLGAILIAMSKRGRGWGDSHRVALVSGALGFFFAIAPLRETHGAPGSVLVALVGVGGLVWLARRVRKVRSPVGADPAVPQG